MRRRIDLVAAVVRGEPEPASAAALFEADKATLRRMSLKELKESLRGDKQERTGKTSKYAGVHKDKCVAAARVRQPPAKARFLTQLRHLRRMHAQAPKTSQEAMACAVLAGQEAPSHRVLQHGRGRRRGVQPVCAAMQPQATHLSTHSRCF
jgi:hypothetical protein